METPIAQPSQSHCNLAGDYFEYQPDPPLDCGATINPCEGCTTATQPLKYFDYHYSNANCTGNLLGVDGPISDGTVEWDTAYSCCG